MNDQNLEKKDSQTSSGKVEVDGNVSGSVIIQGDGNTVTMGGRKPPPPSKKKPRNRRSNKKVLVTAAWIGFFATILAALITVFGSRVFSAPDSSSASRAGAPIAETATASPSPIPTSTVTPVEPTSTFPPETDTPAPLPTDTPIPPVEIGEDWKKGCISTLWIAHPSTIQPSERGDGCWREPVHVFSAENGDLDFLAERRSGPSELYGLFAPLPENGTVTFTIRLKNLSNVDLWVGVFAEPDVSSQGLLMTIPSGSVEKLVFVQRNPRTYDTIQGTIPLAQGGGFSISFTFSTLYVKSSVNPNVFVTNPVSIPSAKKWLFLGYRGSNGTYRIEGRFLNFKLEP